MVAIAAEQARLRVRRQPLEQLGRLLGRAAVELGEGAPAGRGERDELRPAVGGRALARDDAGGLQAPRARG